MFLHLTFPYQNKFQGKKTKSLQMKGEDHANVNHYDIS